jgi:hypothetical protein
MGFDDNAAGLAGRANSVQAGSYVLVFCHTIPLMKLGGWRKIKEQNASKLKRAQGDLSAVF